MNPEVMTESSSFKARDITLRAQKKILSKMAGKNMSRMFIDEGTSSLLDNLYAIAYKYSNDKKESEKLIKNIIKTAIKFAVLYKNEVLDENQKEQIHILKDKLRNLALNIITFHDVDYTYDRSFLIHCIEECRVQLLSIAQIHLSPNSIARINRVFNFFTQESLLNAVFEKSKDEHVKYAEVLSKFVKDLHCAVDNDAL